MSGGMPGKVGKWRTGLYLATPPCCLGHCSQVPLHCQPAGNHLFRSPPLCARCPSPTFSQRRQEAGGMFHQSPSSLRNNICFHAFFRFSFSRMPHLPAACLLFASSKSTFSWWPHLGGRKVQPRLLAPTTMVWAVLPAVFHASCWSSLTPPKKACFSGVGEFSSGLILSRKAGTSCLPWRL